jgi:predicted CopG family antitoxin
MKIYRKTYGYSDSFYFMTTKENGLFEFSLNLPDKETLVLCPCFLGEEEDKIYEKAITVSDDVYKKFNSIYDKKNNYKDVCKLLMEVFTDINQDTLNKAFKRNDKIFEIADKCIKKYGKDFVYNFHYRPIVEAIRECMERWNNDTKRTVKWIVSEEIPEIVSINDAFIDIFGKHHPTKYKLLHKFYNYWGNDLDEIIEKCIQKYPNENDFDLATYYCRDLLFSAKKPTIEIVG